MQSMSGDSVRARPPSGRYLRRLEPASRRWTEQLRPGHPKRDATVAELHAVLLRIAYHELSRRRLNSGRSAARSSTISRSRRLTMPW